MIGNGTFKTAALLGAIATATPAMAVTFTDVNPPAQSDELSHGEILSQIYGQEFTAGGINRHSFTSSDGTINAQRFGDANGARTDQFFDAGEYAASARAVYAGLDQTFGVVAGDDDVSTYDTLFSVESGSGLLSGPSTDYRLFPDGLKFALESGGNLFSSRPGENRNGVDHMVGYLMHGVGDWTAVFFWEDRVIEDADFDYNDFVVEVRATRDIPDDLTPSPAPTPAAFGAGMLMLGGALIRRRRRA